MSDPVSGALLMRYAMCKQGIGTADSNRYVMRSWEVPLSPTWEFYQMAPVSNVLVSGCHSVVRWEKGDGALANSPQARICGEPAWGKRGVAIAVTRDLFRATYLGGMFDCTLGALISLESANAVATEAFVLSGDFLPLVRKIDQALSVTESSLLKVPFDLSAWQQLASEKFPDGLPKPHTCDPTQWLFDGHPKNSHSPLNVAVARLAGYRWPRQTGSSFPDCPALGPDGLESHEDDDGIVPLTAIKGEAGAAERIVSLLATAYGVEWSAAKQIQLLIAAGAEGPLLEDWLLDHFFEQHCAMFHQRPYVWHIWDGRRDGFNVLVNYHKLAAGNGEGKRLLEKLTHTYLGDWIDVQRRDSTAGVEGADARLASAEHLKAELEKILSGEPPYDLFVRWKPLGEQAIGWEPDINDGVRMNIRPFMTARPFSVRAKNACILRVTPKIKWDKDRGKEPERPKQDFPWFWGWGESAQDFAGDATFDGNRWNDLHYTNKAKRAARERTQRSGS